MMFRGGQLSFSRRSLVKGTAGTTAALVYSRALHLDAVAQEEERAAALIFFNTHEAATVDAIAEQVWPTTDASPGASDAGAVYYIDQSLAGAYQDYQHLYRAGIEMLDESTNAAYGSAFVGLSPEQQLEFMIETLGVPAASGDASGTPVSATPEPDILEIEGLDQGDATPVPVEPDITETVTGLPMVAGGDLPSASSVADFLAIVRNHTMEGVFADPAYGGNRDFIGWRAVGYGGPYYVHTEEQQQSFEPLDLPIQSIADL
jgi:gluconate 2-dehydrogenase gamma chain